MKKILLVVLDGFGIREEVSGNAVKQAVLPTFDRLWEEYPHALLDASGEAVGLEPNQFGYSEVGHESLGAGKIILQQERKINLTFEENGFENNVVFNETIGYIGEKKCNTHLMILASDGGVHSSYKHLIKMLELLKKRGVENVYLHLITDGRDTKTQSAYKYINEIEEVIEVLGIGKIASVCGRYYAMDRDQNWNRTQNYYKLITKGTGTQTLDLKKAIEANYQKEITDEFLPPIFLDGGMPIKNGDVLFWLNYRTDRAKQILTSLTNETFNKFPTVKMTNLKLVSFFEVDKKINGRTLLEEEIVKEPFGVYISKLGLLQARIAETEKYAHVTYFFDCGYPEKIEGCDTYNVPSPKVATYNLMPEMSAVGVTRKTIACMEKDYDFILTNFANPDMVGHTGDFVATIKAVQVVDLCLEKIIEAAEENFYKVFIIADHGNADIMFDEEGNKVTTHTSSKVPFIVTDKKIELVETGSLVNVAPTILEYMDIALPKDMRETESLLKKAKKREEE